MLQPVTGRSGFIPFLYFYDIYQFHIISIIPFRLLARMGEIQAETRDIGASRHKSHILIFFYVNL